MTNKINFLMVGTLEPRKGQAQALASFETLWSENRAINLIFIGKKGWKMSSFIMKLLKHPEWGKRLIWLDQVSNQYLEYIYSLSTCFIAASEGEGFGLPLIEAAKHQVPIIARDISVFREVTQNRATFFTGHEPDDLTKTIKHWLESFKHGKLPIAPHPSWLSWQQSTEQLLDVLLKEEWSYRFNAHQGSNWNQLKYQTKARVCRLALWIYCWAPIRRLRECFS